MRKTFASLDEIARHICVVAALTFCFLNVATALAEQRPNLLIITVDDMSADSLASYGCSLEDTAPNIDAFAKTAMRFRHAHVQVGNCMPGRNIMWSGLYSHINGVEGFVQNKNPDYPVLCDLAKSAGYFTAIRGKASHSTPYHPYAWDAVLDTDAEGKKWHVKDAAGYGESTRKGIRLAQQAGKPFCLMVNISDPHKPFYAQGPKGITIADKHKPTRVFTAAEVPTPGFLPEHPAISKELAHYYSSVRRGDDCFASVMQALEESGEVNNTFVMFLSDHGMPLPFAKTQLYHHSTHTPLMVRWPGVTPVNVDDREHMVSAIDFVPTLLEVINHRHPRPEILQGKSFAPVLKGQTQEDREFVLLQYNENSGRNRHPMRGIHTKQYLYLYNAWSNGERKFATATTGTVTYRKMVELAERNPEIADRVALFDHRVVEEFYDIVNDPNCLNNLIADQSAQANINRLRAQLAAELKRIEDPMADLVANYADVEMRQAYMAVEDERVRAAKEAKKKATNANKARQAKQRIKNALALEAPKTIARGQAVELIIRHTIPETLGEQKLQVTLRGITSGRPSQNVQVHRQSPTVRGSGTITLKFQVPDEPRFRAFQFAAFVGEEFNSNLFHIRSKELPAK